MCTQREIEAEETIDSQLRASAGAATESTAAKRKAASASLGDAMAAVAVVAGWQRRPLPSLVFSPGERGEEATD